MTVTLAVGKDKVPIAIPFFKREVTFGTNTSAVSDAAYTRFCANPPVCPSDIYNAVLAYAFISPPTHPQAVALVEVLRAKSKY